MGNLRIRTILSEVAPDSDGQRRFRVQNSFCRERDRGSSRTTARLRQGLRSGPDQGEDRRGHAEQQGRTRRTVQIRGRTGSAVRHGSCDSGEQLGGASHGERAKDGRRPDLEVGERDQGNEQVTARLRQRTRSGSDQGEDRRGRTPNQAERAGRFKSGGGPEAPYAMARATRGSSSGERLAGSGPGDGRGPDPEVGDLRIWPSLLSGVPLRPQRTRWPARSMRRFPGVSSSL